jgi:hypothetical protein
LLAVSALSAYIHLIETGDKHMTKQFEIGKTYATRSICDSDTWFSFTILGRTAKQVTIKVHGKIVKRGLYIYEGVEQFRPYGTYSMFAIIGADDERAAT